MKSIIIADDDPAIRDIFELIFKRAGYEITTYSSGEALIHNEFELPSLFILDMQLSGVDGLEVCKFLKSQESTRNIPVIMLSASPYIAMMSEQAGADDFIAKPFDMSHILAKVNNLIQKRK